MVNTVSPLPALSWFLSSICPQRWEKYLITLQFIMHYIHTHMHYDLTLLKCWEAKVAILSFFPLCQGGRSGIMHSRDSSLWMQLNGACKPSVHHRTSVMYRIPQGHTIQMSPLRTWAQEGLGEAAVLEMVPQHSTGLLGPCLHWVHTDSKSLQSHCLPL